MTPLQITILSVLGCFALTLLGALAGLILYDTNSLANIQPAASISYPTNSPPIPTPRPNNQVSDCDATEVNTWIDQTVPRLNAIDSDMEYLNSYPPNSFDDYIPYAESARQRYNAQLSQRTPACLEGVQEIALEELRLFWKGLEAAANGDGDAVNDYFSRLVEISSQVDQAIQEVEQNK
jgi:hypothetical protein